MKCTRNMGRSRSWSFLGRMNSARLSIGSILLVPSYGRRLKNHPDTAMAVGCTSAYRILPGAIKMYRILRNCSCSKENPRARRCLPGDVATAASWADHDHRNGSRTSAATSSGDSPLSTRVRACCTIGPSTARTSFEGIGCADSRIAIMVRSSSSTLEGRVGI